jgi:uracil-DNA glycosylase
MFTGDASGQFLFAALHRAGFANQPGSTDRNDGLRLHDIYVTASVRCVPPDNKPTPVELANCQPFLHKELIIFQPRVVVCLGRIAFDRVLRIFSVRPADYRFGHGAIHRLPAGPLRQRPWLICSYHPSQQNTLTGRLTPRMFDKIWSHAAQLVEHD